MTDHAQKSVPGPASHGVPFSKAADQGCIEVSSDPSSNYDSSCDDEAPAESFPKPRSSKNSVAQSFDETPSRAPNANPAVPSTTASRRDLLQTPKVPLVDADGAPNKVPAPQPPTVGSLASPFGTCRTRPVSHEQMYRDTLYLEIVLLMASLDLPVDALGAIIANSSDHCKIRAKAQKVTTVCVDEWKVYQQLVKAPNRSKNPLVHAAVKASNNAGSEINQFTNQIQKRLKSMLRDGVPKGLASQDFRAVSDFSSHVNCAATFRPSLTHPPALDGDIFCLGHGAPLDIAGDQHDLIVPASLFPNKRIPLTLTPTELAAAAASKPLKSGRVQALASMQLLYVPSPVAAPAAPVAPLGTIDPAPFSQLALPYNIAHSHSCR